MKQTARNSALEALLQMEENEGYSNIVIDKTLRASSLDRRDAALASTIFYGVLERRMTLDFYLRQCFTDPKRKVDQTVFMILRCAAYQILCLDRIPDSASVNEAVNGVKEHEKSSYAGMVNGVLRSLIRKKDEIKLPEGNGVRALSLRYSVPEKLVSLWIDAYGQEITEKILCAFQEKAQLYIRVNTLKTTPEKLKASLEATEIGLELLEAPYGAGILTGCGSPVSLPQFGEGMFHVQDLSAQLVCELLGPENGGLICDCCAAPGGKSFTLAEMLEGSGKVYALDLYRGRVGLISQGANRLGIGSIEARVNDASKGFTGLPLMDRVLCDVPCSGYGVIRRKPEIRYKDVSTVAELPKLQLSILKNASALVKPGGILVYSTCTLNPSENGGVAEQFLRENSGFEPMTIDLPGVRPTIKEPANQLTMMPFAGASDGFFAAVFRKKQS